MVFVDVVHVRVCKQADFCGLLCFAVAIECYWTPWKGIAALFRNSDGLGFVQNHQELRCNQMPLRFFSCGNLRFAFRFYLRGFWFRLVWLVKPLCVCVWVCLIYVNRMWSNWIDAHRASIDDGDENGERARNVFLPNILFFSARLIRNEYLKFLGDSIESLHINVGHRKSA